jgi:nitrate/TMAO reductase-like tetraheme cytochrome c subunit
VSDGDVQEPQQTVDEPRGRSRRFVAVMVAIVVCVVAIILLIPVAATSSSSYCGSCHSMKQAYRSWQRGAHSAVPCSECHIPPGTVAAVKWRTTEARNIWLTYLNMKPARDTQPPPASENCEKCHPLKGLMGIPGKIRMPHARHINQNNLECIDCHDHTAHAAPGESSAVSMAPCTMCHEQTTDTNRCDFCHYTPPVTGKSHPTDFLTEHGSLAIANERDCLRCHHNKKDFCDGCHEKPTPGHYSGNWPYAHGKEAKKDRDRCLGCHTEEQLCNQCHTVDHPADWATAHAPVAAKGMRSCLVCHPTQMCDDCHAAEGVSTQVTTQ